MIAFLIWLISLNECDVETSLKLSPRDSLSPVCFMVACEAVLSNMLLLSLSSSVHMSLSFSLQLNALSGENKQLRRQLEEERSMRLLPPPPTSQQRSSVFSLSSRPPPPSTSNSTSTSLPSSLRPPHPLSLHTVDFDGILTRTELGRAGLERPGESRASAEAFRIRPTASVSPEATRSGRTSRDLTKWSPLKTLTCHDFLTYSSSPGSALSMRLMSCRSKSCPRVLFARGVL